jgi:hypothetical protein
MKLGYVVAIPSSRLVHHMASLIPLVSQNAGHATVLEMLRPRHVMIVYVPKWQFPFTLKYESWTYTIQGLAKAVRGERHRVEIDPVGFTGLDHIGQSVDIRHRLTVSPHIPRCVHNQYAYSAMMTLPHDFPQTI